LLLADVAEMLAQRDPAIGETIGQTNDRELFALNPIGHGTGPRQQLASGLNDVPGLELVHPGEAFAAAQHDRRGNPLHHVPDETPWHSAFVERIEKMGLDPVRHTPQEFAESIRMQVNTWREVIRKAGIKPE
jgi:hypothetical protein